MSRAVEETNRRMLRARDAMFLLVQTDRSVTDICFSVGFSSLGTFSRTFRSIVGQSPTEYRATHEPIPDVPGCFTMAWARLAHRDPPGQPDREILLETPGEPSHDDATAEQIRELVAKGAMGFTLGLRTDDCRKTYEDLKARGVEFTEEPTERFYGVDCGLRDPFGNHIRLVQPAPEPIQVPAPAAGG